MEPVVRIGEAEIDLVERRVTTPRGDAVLTELEAQLLRFLVARRGTTTTRRELLEQVWGYSPRTVTRAVDHTVSRLRRKLEVDPRRPRWLTSTRGDGYRLELPPIEAAPLPEEPSSFVGRQAEIDEVLAALEAHPVVVLLGLGGMGKSRVALRVARIARERGSEVAVVGLGGAGSRGEARGRVAQALGVHADDLDDALDDKDHLLVVLDEVERLPADALDLVRPRGPRFLLTSQRPEPAATHTVELGPLTLADGLALLAARCPVRLTEADATRVVEALDRVPFALELAASWLAAGTPDEVLARVGSLRGVGPSRHGTVEAALLGSWSLLSDEARALLGEAAGFAAPFRVTDLEAVSGTADVLPITAELVTRGWLLRRGRGLAMGSVVRRFVEARGAVPADSRERRVAWLLSWVPAARRAQARRWDREQHQRLTEAEPELRAVLAEDLDPARAVPLVLALHRQHGDGSVPLDLAVEEVRRVLRRIPDDAPELAAITAIHALVASVAGRLDEAGTSVERGYGGLARSPTPDEDRCVLDGVAATVLLFRGDAAAAVDRFTAAVAAARALGNPVAAGIFLSNLANVVAREDPARAIGLLDEALGELADLGAPAALGRVHANLARLLRATGAVEAGDSHHARAEVLFREAGDRRALTQLLVNHGHHLLDLGDRAGSRRTSEEALALARALGLRQTGAIATLTLAMVHLDERAPAAALDLALAAQRSLWDGNPFVQREAAWCVGHAELALGRPDRAAVAFEAALAGARRSGVPGHGAAAGLALARIAQGDPTGAATAAAGLPPDLAAVVSAAIDGVALAEPGAADSYRRVLVQAARRIVEARGLTPR